MESKLSKAETPDLALNEALMLFKERLQNVCRCSVVNASVSLTRAKLRALQMPQSFTVEPEATLVPQLGSADSKSCFDKPSTACLCNETRNGQLVQHPTVTPDRITAVANQVADATKSKDTTKSATERRSKIQVEHCVC